MAFPGNAPCALDVRVKSRLDTSVPVSRNWPGGRAVPTTEEEFSMRAAKRSMAICALGLVAVLHPPAARGEDSTIHFSLAVNPKFAACLAQFPGDPSRPPTADVAVRRGKLNDTLRIQLNDIKPGLAFDMFTVQNSQLLADGSVDPGFAGFGLAW